MADSRKYIFLTMCGISILIYPLSFLVDINNVFSPSAVSSLANSSQVQKSSEFKNKSTQANVCFNQTNRPKILLWTDFWGTRFFKATINCKCKCDHITDKSQWDVSDAIIFHTPDASGPLPPGRIQHQKWIFYMHESPFLGAVHDSRLKDIFNWTMTYQRDSHIFLPYGKLQRRENPIPMQPQPSQRSKMAAWMVSHCDTVGQRELLFDKLNKLVITTKYGKCNGNICGKERVTCMEDFRKEHYFYLAFENSICDDYVTEKLWNALAVGLVPVVYGGADYEALLPPHSFIDILHFKNINALADYLIYLSKNVTAYQEYLRWSEDYTIDLSFYEWGFCDLCEALFIEREKPTITTVMDIIEYFSVQRRCIRRQGEKENFFNNSP